MPDHHGAPYSLTEDFVTVYRLHPLLPDDYRFVDHQTGDLLGRHGLPRHPGRRRRRRDARSSACDEHALLVRHRPSRARSRCTTTRASLQSFERDGEIIDLSVVDLVRTRRRGVPRYNDFRAGLHKPRVSALGGAAATNRGVGAPAARGLPRHRRGRHDGRAVRRDAAGGLRLLATRPSASSS